MEGLHWRLISSNTSHSAYWNSNIMHPYLFLSCRRFALHFRLMPHSFNWFDLYWLDTLTKGWCMIEHAVTSEVLDCRWEGDGRKRQSRKRIHKSDTQKSKEGMQIRSRWMVSKMETGKDTRQEQNRKGTRTRKEICKRKKKRSQWHRRRAHSLRCVLGNSNQTLLFVRAYVFTYVRKLF